MDLFSSVRLGITLLVVLFVYASLGSAGLWYPGSPNILAPWRSVQIRQLPVFEMTEYEWFHTPFFTGLCLLICLNIIVTTVRRIPLRVVNLGVWTIHTGIIVLVAGSIVYFGTKIEGDTPVFRRMVVVTSDNGSTLTLPALPQRSGTLTTSRGRYRISVASIDPQWPLLSGDDAGTRAYSVTLGVEGPDGRFMRQVIDGHPQYTEDVIPGVGRAVKTEEFGRKIIDDSLSVALDYFPQTRFWIKDTSAVAIREIGPGGKRGAWIAVPLEHLPRYNDYAAAVAGDVVGADEGARSRGLDIPVRLPLGESVFEARVDAYLRYAARQSSYEPGGTALQPVVELAVQTPVAGSIRRTLAAFDPRHTQAFDGLVGFRYAPDASELERLEATATPRLTLTTDNDQTLAINLGATDLDQERFVRIGDSDWRVRIENVVNDLGLDDGRIVSLVILEVESPEGARFTRWVFEDENLTRDLTPDAAMAAHAEPAPEAPDARLATAFQRGLGAPLVIVAGPGDVGLRAFLLGREGEYESRDVRVGEAFPLAQTGTSITIERYMERARRSERLVVVPPAQRDRSTDLARANSMVHVEIETGGEPLGVWLPFHRFALEDESLAAPGLGRCEPAILRTPDGRTIEMIFTRESRGLPTPVALEDFEVTTYAGGYSGEVSSIRDWTSVLRFWDGEGWGERVEVRSNKPAEVRGLRYFQAFWDAAPSRMSAGEALPTGLNFTGLGVGNRHGVGMQLAGSGLAVLGMLYAFYVKPIIKRRRRERVMREIATLAETEAETRLVSRETTDRDDLVESFGMRRATIDEEGAP